MQSRSDTVLRSFIECSLKVMKGESSLVIHEAGECTIDVHQEPSSKNCDVQIRCGKRKIIPSFLLVIVVRYYLTTILIFKRRICAIYHYFSL